MASIVSSLNNEQEKLLQNFFSTPVRLHLLYKSSHHGANVAQLLSSFDNYGKFFIAVFLPSGSVRGAFMSKSLKCGTEFSDAEAFVFEIKEHDAKQFPVINAAKAITVSRQKAAHHQDGFGFGSSTTYTQTADVIAFGSCCADVELHRVQDVFGLFPTPWREVSWTDTTRESLRKEFVSFKLPTNYPVSQMKALLLGPVGSGKSCFINSIRSTMYKRIVHLPNVGTAVNGFTKKLNNYDIRGGKGGSPTVLSFCDMMAFGDDDSTGLSSADAISVIKGHIPKGYKFQPDAPATDAVSGYKKNPSINEQVHCVLFMLDAYKLGSYPSSLKSTLRKLHTTTSELGIPLLILLTHVDQVCPAVQENLMHVYSSRNVQEKMEKAAELVGLPLCYVLPVKNYVSQLTVDCNTDILLLSAVMSILQAVDDTLEDQYPVQWPLSRSLIYPN
ncbi:interferon-induced protein 44-like isoform X2 [Silurus meridionalis]|uniref:interferon-induced protein 44-like isoform X2 n=1 Tax=Silurus meridionalis TaxID=175797 RepID=UPI001EE9D8D0|nr:interferon-induced protein 44-like isoform X2 [Silurus meridionalis]